MNGDSFERLGLASTVRRIASIAVGLIAALAYSSAAFAFRVTPLAVDVGTIGSSAGTRFEVENLTANTIPVEVSIISLILDQDGVRDGPRADDEFLVFPPVFQLEPGERQVVRVQYVGDPEVARSHAYHIDFRQAPVALDEEAPVQLQVLYAIRSLLTVVPPGSEPALTVLSSRIVPSDDGGRQLVAHVRNDGTRYASLGAVAWRISGLANDGEESRQVVETGDVRAAVGLAYIDASGGERIFTMPVSENFALGDVTLSFG